MAATSKLIPPGLQKLQAAHTRRVGQLEEFFALTERIRELAEEIERHNTRQNELVGNLVGDGLAAGELIGIIGWKMNRINTAVAGKRRNTPDVLAPVAS